MHHSNEQAFTDILMLVFSRCTVAFNNYSTFFYGPLHTTGLFSCYRIIIEFEYESLKPRIFKTTKLNCQVFLLFVTYNIISNVRMATGRADSILKRNEHFL